MKFLISILIFSILSMRISCDNPSQKEKSDKVAAETAMIDGEASASDKNIQELDAESFKIKVFDYTSDTKTYLGDKPAIVDFNATWCGPCKQIAPILEELSVEYKDKIVIYTVDIDESPELAKAFKIRSIPAILYIPVGGAEPVKTVGGRNKETFIKEIKDILKVE